MTLIAFIRHVACLNPALFTIAVNLRLLIAKLLSRCEGTVVYRRVRKVAKKRLFASSCPSVRLSAWKTSAPTERIFIKFDI
jgi:hypothetical protein